MQGDEKRDEKFADDAKEQLTVAEQSAKQGDDLATEAAVLTAWDNMRLAYKGEVPADKVAEFRSVVDQTLGGLSAKSSVLDSLGKEQNRDPEAIKQTQELVMEALRAVKEKNWNKFKLLKVDTGTSAPGASKVMYDAYQSHVKTYHGDVTPKGFERFTKAAAAINKEFPFNFGEKADRWLGQSLQLAQSMSLPRGLKEDYRTEFAANLVQLIYEILAFQSEHRTADEAGILYRSYVGHGPKGGGEYRLKNLTRNLQGYLDPAWMTEFRSLLDELDKESTKSNAQIGIRSGVTVDEKGY